MLYDKLTSKTYGTPLQKCTWDVITKGQHKNIPTPTHPHSHPYSTSNLWEMALIVRSIFLWESERKWKAINTNNMLYVHESNTHTHTPIAILEWILYVDSYIYSCNSIFTWWHKGILFHSLVIRSIINDLILEYNIVFVFWHFLLLLMVHIERTLICLVFTRTW